MSRLTSTLAANRKLSAWLAFGAAGLATGAVWASGFATVGGENRLGGSAISPALAKTAPTPASSDLNGKADDVSPIAFDWQGRWGSIHANTVLFKVDLSGFTGKTYNIATLLTNTTDLTGWASLQLKLEQKQIASGSSACDPADFTGSTNDQLLNVDDQDAGVYWNGLAGDKVYCIGISAAHGDDAAGTFLRAAQDTPPTSFPTFITTVDRAS